MSITHGGGRRSAHGAARGGRGAATILAIGAALALLLLGSTSAAQAMTATVSTNTYGTVYEHLFYGPRVRENVNVYASRSPKSPTVILVHGGGWRFYDALSKFEAESLALQAQGFTVFTINYDQDSSTSPAFSIEPEEVAAATHWAMNNASSFNADPSNVTLLGGSAGGHLVGLVAQRLNAAAAGTIRGVVTLSAPESFRTLIPMIEGRVITNEEFVTSVYQAVGREVDGPSYMFANPFEQEAYETRWSPALNISSRNCTRWLLFNSEAEFIPLSQAQEMNNGLTQAGCPSTLKVVPGSRHAFGYWKEVAPLVFSFIRGS